MENRKLEQNDNGDGDGEDEPIDWTDLFELAVLCPAPVDYDSDRELDMVLSGVEPVPSLQGTVFS